MTRSRAEVEELVSREWELADRKGEGMRDSFQAIDQMIALYKSLEPSEEEVMEDLICGWLEVEDPKRLYDAINLIRELRIFRAIEPLRRLQATIEDRTDHEAPFDWSTINRTLGFLLEESERKDDPPRMDGEQF